MCPCSYSFWAADIVLETENPNFLDASCCKVEVVNGGVGFFSIGFLVTESTVKLESRKPFKKESNESSLFTLFRYLDFSDSPEILLKKATVLKDSWGLKSLISFSRSAINLRATDWTLPAESPPFTFLHSMGEIL